MKVLHNIMN